MSIHDKPLRLRVGARTERGRREENQDQMTGFPFRSGAIYLVADGMGGHRGGAEASRLVAEGYRRFLARAGLETPLKDLLQAATAAVNAEILEQAASADKRGMGSTVVLVALRPTEDGPEYVVGHVGDSRAYLLVSGELRRLTRDHSMVQRLVDENLVASEEAKNHPKSNVLIRAMGQAEEVQMDISEPSLLERGARLLLCTDGLWGFVGDEEILENAAQSPDPEELAARLVELALLKESDDNVTVQVLCPDTSRITAPEFHRSDDAQAGQDVGSAAATGVLPSEPNRWFRSPRKILMLAAVSLCIAGSGTYWFLRWHPTSQVAHPQVPIAPVRRPAHGEPPKRTPR